MQNTNKIATKLIIEADTDANGNVTVLCSFNNSRPSVRFTCQKPTGGKEFPEIALIRAIAQVPVSLTSCVTHDILEAPRRWSEVGKLNEERREIMAGVVGCLENPDRLPRPYEEARARIMEIDRLIAIYFFLNPEPQGMSGMSAVNQSVPMEQATCGEDSPKSNR